MKQKDVFPGWGYVTGASLSRQELDRDFRAVMSLAGSLESPKKSFRGLWRSYPMAFRMAFAAACTLLLGLAVFRFTTLPRPAETVVSRNISYTTGKGEVREVTLPDGSKVTLNTGSLLICPDRFGPSRSVWLLGEAIFEVTASDESPFEVNTADMTVLAHGTRFNVKAYHDDSDVRTTLCRGAVDAWPAGHRDRAVVLEPGQTLIYDKSSESMVVSNGNPAEATSWEHGELRFYSESIQGVIRILERHFNVNVYLTSDKYDNAIITASFIHGEALEDLLKAVSAVIPGMKYSIEGDKVYLK